MRLNLKAHLKVFLLCHLCVACGTRADLLGCWDARRCHTADMTVKMTVCVMCLQPAMLCQWQGHSVLIQLTCCAGTALQARRMNRGSGFSGNLPLLAASACSLASPTGRGNSPGSTPAGSTHPCSQQGAGSEQCKPPRARTARIGPSGKLQRAACQHPRPPARCNKPPVSLDGNQCVAASRLPESKATQCIAQGRLLGCQSRPVWGGQRRQPG